MITVITIEHMADHRVTEAKMLEVLRTPPRFELPVPPGNSLEEIFRKSLMETFFIARQAWSVARPMAISHRDCIVVAGASLLSYDLRTIHRVFGYNFKPSQGDTPNLHAEELILLQAQRYGATVLNLTVVGEPQKDNSISGNDLVLAPCDYRCTPKIVAAESVGSFSMTTCVNPKTGATQFIPNSMLESRDWSSLPAIEVSALNDFGEWGRKARPVIEMLIEWAEIEELESFTAIRRAQWNDRLSRYPLESPTGTSGGFESSFAVAPSSLVLGTSVDPPSVLFNATYPTYYIDYAPSQPITEEHYSF